MSAHCQLTGAVPRFGHSISHSHRRTRRQFRPNVQRKTYYVPSLGRRVTLRLSTTAIKTIDRIGIESAIVRIRARGEQV